MNFRILTSCKTKTGYVYQILAINGSQSQGKIRELTEKIPSYFNQNHPVDVDNVAEIQYLTTVGSGF